MKKLLLFALLLGPLQPAFATWDETTPSGTEAKSLGDDRIRELKIDIRTALDVEGVFPGTTTASPKFFYTPSTGTTAQRPVGDMAPQGRLYINVSSATLEQAQSDGSWSALDVVPSSHITPGKIANTVAGPGLGGGAGAPLHAQIDSNIFSVATDSLTINTGGITSTHILDGTISSSDLSSTAIQYVNISTFSKFIVQGTASQNNVTGDGTEYQVLFGTEIHDALGDFASSAFTAPTTGIYQLNTCVGKVQAVTASAEVLSIQIRTSNRNYYTWYSNTAGSDALNTHCLSTLADMDAADTARVFIVDSGGTASIDIDNAYTFFSGALLR